MRSVELRAELGAEPRSRRSGQFEEGQCVRVTPHQPDGINKFNRVADNMRIPGPVRLPSQLLDTSTIAIQMSRSWHYRYVVLQSDEILRPGAN